MKSSWFSSFIYFFYKKKFTAVVNNILSFISSFHGWWISQVISSDMQIYVKTAVTSIFNFIINLTRKIKNHIKKLIKIQRWLEMLKSNTLVFYILFFFDNIFIIFSLFRSITWGYIRFLIFRWEFWDKTPEGVVNFCWTKKINK